MDLGRMSLAVSADTPEKQCYVKFCRDFDMDPAWVNQDFKHKITGKEFTLLGLKKKGPLFTVIIQAKNSSLKESYSIKQFMDNCNKMED